MPGILPSRPLSLHNGYILEFTTCKLLVRAAFTSVSNATISTMMAGPLEFGGEETFAASPERLFAALTDVDTLAATIPDVVSSEKPDLQTLKCVVRPKFSFLRATMRLSVTLADLAPPRSATMRVTAEGIGASMQVTSVLAIEPTASGSRMTWTARIERLGGLLATVPGGLVKGAADQVIRQGWQQVRERLGEAA
jgi:carbon monoxide dehydrogenase subunit G